METWMATRAKKQTAWALRLQNLPEMLEPHLAEIKLQRESKLGHPEPVAHGNLLHDTLHWEKRRTAVSPDTSSKPAWETFARPTSEH
jgi:hypothetical protein